MNKYNADGQRHGPWESYWKGQLHSKGSYVNGKQHGTWETYHDNGQLQYKAIWSMNIKVGFWEIFTRDNESCGKQFFL